MPKPDPFESPEWRVYAADALENLVPKLRESFATVSLVPTGETDIKFAVELGLSIMMDKPIVAVVWPGVKVPAKLLLVADAIVEGAPDDPGLGERLMAALVELGVDVGEA